MSNHANDQRPLVVVMGVSGSGKTTVGQALADRLGVPYADADTFHSEASVAKMASGHPLDDDDRAPWLLAIGAWLAEHDATGAVVGCSALRRRYRDVLRSAAPRLELLHLAGDPAVLTQRVAERPGHFMPASLITSQLETLEALEADERGRVLDLTAPVDEIVASFAASLTNPGARP
ncbi:gluconokinase [Pengzhenrongella sicca]|uniref:Gluconokinase n=1 Tax=Pengzhenrongella sicca TaxID=2819238 RepID=A0A8A4ZBN1_9MICO|nr:gluconokinase [Pengzhenrongella sicca]QTE29294.1 gluconokinase [Pengzhenrongella sicca]